MTTDTAVLVSHEILGQQRPFASLPFVDEPAVPMDDTVVHFLDSKLPISAMLSTIPNDNSDGFASLVNGVLRPEA